MIEKRFGILGGMGPEATILFYKHILDLSDVRLDQEHLETVIAILPHIPDRTAAILSDGEDPSPYILDGIKLLAQAGAEFAVITCNTAHHFLSKIQERLPIPVLNMIQLVATEIKNNGLTRVGLLATDGTIKTKLYDRYLSEMNIEIIKPNRTYQKLVMKIIYGTKGIKAGYVGEANRQMLLTCINNLLGQGAQAVILGCTELPLVLKKEDTFLQIIDPFLILAKETIKKAKGDTYVKT